MLRSTEIQLGSSRIVMAAAPAPEDGSTKLFLGGLSYDSTEDSISSYFMEKYGQVGDTQVVRDRMTNQSRGFGFVSFLDPDIAMQAQQAEHMIDGRSVMARKATPKSETPVGGGGYMGGPPTGMTPTGGDGSGDSSGVITPAIQALPDFNPQKIFVGGVSHSVDEEQFKGYFAAYGEVTEAWLMYDPQTQRPRGFGFVVFATAEALNAVCATTHHEIAGKMVEVKRATPRSANPPPQRSMGGKGGMGMGRGGGRGFGGGGGGYGGGYGGMMNPMMNPMMGGYGGCGGYGGGYNDMANAFASAPLPDFSNMGQMGMGAMGGAMGMGGYGAMGSGAMGGMGCGMGGMGGYGCGTGCDASAGQMAAPGMGGATSATGVVGTGGMAAYAGGQSMAQPNASYGAARTSAAAGREQRSYTPY